jgi:hypothetical protein
MGWRNGKAWSVGFVVLVLLAANAWFWFGRDRSDGTDSGGVVDEATSTTTPRSVEADSLETRTYEPGDCATWNPSSGTADTQVVDCSQPHLIEMAGSVDLHDDPTVGRTYPNEQAWDVIIARSCDPVVATHFGGAVDPNGRWRVSAIHPREDGWAQGDRTVWCGLISGDADGVGATGAWVSSSGPADLSAQAVERPVGQCRAIQPSGSTAAVDCAQAHQLEFVGMAVLPDAGAYPGQEAVQAACLRLVQPYVGSSAAFSYGSWGFDDRSWDAGVRRVNCVVGSSGDVDGWGTRTSSVHR